MRTFKRPSISSIVLFLLFISIKSWAQDLELTATGDQLYCPLSSIPVVVDFNLQNPINEPINAVYIQISSGYQRGTYFLEINNSNPSISSSYDQSSGKLKLTLANGISNTAIIDAVKAVTFRSTSATISGDRIFSISIGDANYLPSTEHYYKFIDSFEITWQDARSDAEKENYYGRQGYLATLLSEEEATFAGKQANGTGWIGGTDEQTEGVWKWVTGPEATNGGLVFWNGAVDGTSSNYANWNTNEPNNTNGGEDYAHITDPSIGRPGAWNDLRTSGEENAAYKAKGYIVEFGGMPSDIPVKIAASTKITIPKITSATGDEGCGPGVLTLSATATAGSINWYDSQTSTSAVATGPNFTVNLNASKDYYVAAEASGCNTGRRTRVSATVLKAVTAANQITFTNCDEDGTPDGFTDFNLNEAKPFITSDTGVNITFFSNQTDAETNSKPLNPSPYNNTNGSAIYARTSSTNGCYKLTKINLSVSTTSLPSGYVNTLTNCDTDGIVDGFSTFDLTEATSDFLSQFPGNQNLSVRYFRNELDALLEQNEIVPQNSYKNEVQNQQILYVRMEDATGGSCYAIGPHLQLSVEPVPEFELNNEENLCTTATTVTLQALNPKGVYSYEWLDENGIVISTDPDATVSSEGIYTVTAKTAYGCFSEPMAISVVYSEAATLNSNNISVTSIDNQNTVTVLNISELGTGDYEFALGNAIGPYQDSPIFNHVLPGFKTLYVRDKNGCGISSMPVAILGFANYFTPNNDGYHDIWLPLGLNQDDYVSVSIKVFDRFGKLLKSIYGFDQGWDGTTRGFNLPSDDYWYRVSLIDVNGNNSEFKGHMTLKR